MRYHYLPASIAATDAAVARDMTPPPPPARWRVLQFATPVEVDDDRVCSGARSFALAVAGAFTRKGSTSCRMCGRWLEGDWNHAKRKAVREDLQRQMDAGRCDPCAIRATVRLTWSLAESADGAEQVAAVVVRALDEHGHVAAYASWHNDRTAGAVALTADGPRAVGLTPLTRALQGLPPLPPPAPREPPMKLPCRFGCGKEVRYLSDLFTPYKHDCTPAGAGGKEGAR